MAELHAWIDESGSDRARDPNTYILAAAICAQDSIDSVRGAMRPLRRRGTPKLHWRDETKPARRMEITETIAGCPDLKHLIVVRVGVASENQRRPRRAALKQLLLHLDDLKVGRAVLESRGTADDHRDIEVLRHLRDRQHTISTRLRVDHAPGRTDEGLWVPDALCGAMLASRVGAPEYLEVLRGRVTVVTIDHRGDILP